MGYFKRRRDRGRSRALIRRLAHESALDPDSLPTWEVVPSAPPTKRCYLRIACAEIHEYSGRRVGIFAAAAELEENDELDADTRAALDDVLDWFNEHLPVPTGFDVPAAVFLFKSSAGTVMSRIWELVHLLDEHGVPCEMQVFRDPGLIVYQDWSQVAVVPSAGPSDL